MTDRPRPRTGFTLLEVLVAVSIMAVLLILLRQGVQFGLRAATLQAGTQAGRADLDAVDRAVRRLVALADPGQFPEPATLQGDASSVSVTTELPGGTGRAAASLFAADGQLRMRWTPLLHREPFGAAPPAQETVILDGVSALKLAYRARRSTAWSAAWREEKLPALVRLTLVFDPATMRRWPPIIVAPLREPMQE